jgi:glycosyltransferase involved in cell wall biosynthesis
MMEENKFIIVILCYNCHEYIQECIESVVNQKYENYEVVIINDCSVDNTQQVIKKIVNDNKKFKVIDNIERLGPLGNHIKALSVKEFDDNDIIVHLDGDDKFIGSDVLSTLDNAYSKNKNHLVSYGNYKTASGSASICKSWNKSISVSEYIAPVGWIFSHVRSFKYKLWTLIDKQKSFYDSNNKLFSSAGDVAIIKPILELAGRHRTMFFNKVMYFYRDNTSLNEHNDHLRDQIRCAFEIRNKPTLTLYD